MASGPHFAFSTTNAAFRTISFTLAAGSNPTVSAEFPQWTVSGSNEYSHVELAQFINDAIDGNTTVSDDIAANSYVAAQLPRFKWNGQLNRFYVEQPDKDAIHLSSVSIGSYVNPLTSQAHFSSDPDVGLNAYGVLEALGMAVTETADDGLGTNMTSVNTALASAAWSSSAFVFADADPQMTSAVLESTIKTVVNAAAADLNAIKSTHVGDMHLTLDLDLNGKIFGGINAIAFSRQADVSVDNQTQQFADEQKALEAAFIGSVMTNVEGADLKLDWAADPAHLNIRGNQAQIVLGSTSLNLQYYIETALKSVLFPHDPENTTNVVLDGTKVQSWTNYNATLSSEQTNFGKSVFTKAQMLDLSKALVAAGAVKHISATNHEIYMPKNMMIAVQVYVSAARSVQDDGQGTYADYALTLALRQNV